MINRLIHGVDYFSRAVGHAFAWCIVILTFGTTYEVFMRYVMDDPTSWAFDLSYIMYGGLFLMAGAYTLSRNGHVRGDFVYRIWAPRTQAIVDLVLYVIFFFPGVLALVIAGWGYGYESFRIREVSVNSPAGIPVWPLKMLIPFGAGVLALQGVAEVARCILCIRGNHWPPRLHDVEELENTLIQEHAKNASDAVAKEGSK